MQQKRLKLKQQAIDSAEKYIRESGVSSVNARLIAKSADCSVGTLYNNFKNIDFLISSVNAKTLDDLKTHLEHAASGADKGFPAIQKIASSYLTFALEHRNLWLALFEYQFPSPADAPPEHCQQRSLLFQIFESQLQFIDAKIPQESLALEARTLWASIHGVVLLSIDEELANKQNAEEILACLLSKFSTHQGEGSQ